MHIMNNRITMEDLAALTATEAEIKALPEAASRASDYDGEPGEDYASDTLTESEEYDHARYQSECDDTIVLEFSTCIHEAIPKCGHHAHGLLETIETQVERRKNGVAERDCPGCNRKILDCWKLEGQSLAFSISHPVLFAWAYHSKDIAR